jgi:hypothetical protein
MPVILTRYLYALDECFYSLLFGLINKTHFDEIIFWTGEIYYSGFEDKLWEHIWKMYYDFYAIKYPKFEKKINNMAKDWQNNPTIENILYILNLLYYSTINYDVFMMRMSDIESPNVVYMGRKPSWLKKLQLDKYEAKLIRSIHENKKVNILFYLNYCIKASNIYRCYEIIKLYYNTIHNYNLKEKDIDSIHYTNKKHILLALLCHLNLPEKEIQNKTIFKKFNSALTQKQINFNNKEIFPVYKTLIHKRLYGISPLIGLFRLDRHDANTDYKDILRLYWDYFISETPIWKKRLDTYGGKVMKVTKSIQFDLDDNYEIFYERYNYEPDEQSQEVQDKSIGNIDKESGKRWLNSIIQDGNYNWVDIAKWKTGY